MISNAGHYQEYVSGFNRNLIGLCFGSLMWHVFRHKFYLRLYVHWSLLSEISLDVFFAKAFSVFAEHHV